MALMYKKGCKACATIRAENPLHMTEARLYKLINDVYMKRTTLTAVAEAYPISYPGLLNHKKKHQNPSTRDLAKTAKGEVVKRTRLNEIAELRHQNEVLQTTINKVMEKLENGDFDDKMTLKDGLYAAKIKGDFELKQVDQQLELAKMYEHFASGAGRGQVEPVEGEVVAED